MTISLFVLSTSALAQWMGFNVAQTTGTVGEREARVYFQALALVSGSPHLSPYIHQNEKGTVGVSLVAPVFSRESAVLENNSGIFPGLYLHFKISENLYLKGMMSTLNSGSNVAQYAAYGFIYFPGKPDERSWVFQWTRSRISGLKDFRIKTVDFMLHREFNLFGALPLKLGAGTTLFDIDMFSPLVADLGKGYESSRGYLIIGYEFRIKSMRITPGIKINSQHFQLAVDCNLGF